MFKKSFLFFSLLVAVIACKKDPAFMIEGVITNAQSDMIYLEKLEVEGAVRYDSAAIGADGKFKLKGSVSHPTFFLLKLNQNKFITLLLDSMERVSFSADYLNFSNEYKIEGSLGSEKVHDLNRQLTRTLTKIDSINSLIALCFNDIDFREKNAFWGQEKQNLIEAQNEFSKKFVLDNPFSLASILAIYQRYNDESYVVQDLQTIKTAASALHTMYPQSGHAKALYEDTKRMMKNMNAIQMKEFIDAYGRNSPDITLPNVDGKEIALSSLEGKYVLLQFWSVYDRGSQILNPVLKENYNKFKSKGFEIYQVSVDTVRTDWVDAINEEQLNWIHVGDMQGSDLAVMNYNVRSLPTNFLLDREGKIIAKDLKGPALFKTLSEILN